MSYYHNHEWATETLESARSKSAGKPVQNNTRLFEREDGAIGVQFHAVDVVTINSDGTYTLRNGGWNTVTTLERIRGYSPAKIGSDRGEWFITIEPSDSDPAPDYVGRSIPKPYTAGDYRDEPVKSDDGCIAGQLVTTEHVNELVETYRMDVRDGDEIVEVVRESSISSDRYDTVKVKRTWTDHVWIGENAISYHDEGWQNLFPGTYNSTNTNDSGEIVKYVQCSHCKAFDAEYEAWRHWMYGERWGTKFDQQTGYATYIEMMERFHNDKDLWQKAYIADFRARRAYLKAEREWTERNRVPFYDGITVNSDGYAPRVRKDGPSPAKLRRHKREVTKIQKMIDRYVDGFVAELRKGTMPMPGSGDCWMCSLTSSADGTPMGDAMDTLHPDGTVTKQANHEHLWSHIEEEYYVPSLVTNALLERGYKPVGCYMILDMNQDTGTMGGRGNYSNVKRDLRKYMVSRLVP